MIKNITVSVFVGFWNAFPWSLQPKHCCIVLVFEKQKVELNVDYQNSVADYKL